MTDLLKKRIRLKYLFYFITTSSISFSSAVVCRFFLQFKLDFRLNFSIKIFSRDRTKVGQTNIFRWPKLAKTFSKVGQSLTFHLASGVPTFIWASSSRMVIMVTPTFVLIQYTTIIPSVDRNTTMYLLGMYGQEQQPLELASDMSESLPLTWLSFRGSPSLVRPWPLFSGLSRLLSSAVELLSGDAVSCDVNISALWVDGPNSALWFCIQAFFISWRDRELSTNCTRT